MILLKASNLVKIYGPRKVVDEVSFEVGHREVIGLLGRNGAGKTTTFRMVMGMVVPDGGQVLFDGFEITKLPMYKRARRGMGYLSQEPSIFQRMTVEQNLLAILETTRRTMAQRKEEAERLKLIEDLTEALAQAKRFFAPAAAPGPAAATPAEGVTNL